MPCILPISTCVRRENGRKELLLHGREKNCGSGKKSRQRCLSLFFSRMHAAHLRARYRATQQHLFRENIKIYSLSTAYMYVCKSVLCCVRMMRAHLTGYIPSTALFLVNFVFCAILGVFSLGFALDVMRPHRVLLWFRVSSFVYCEAFFGTVILRYSFTETRTDA